MQKDGTGNYNIKGGNSIFSCTCSKCRIQLISVIYANFVNIGKEQGIQVKEVSVSGERQRLAERQADRDMERGMLKEMVGKTTEQTGMAETGPRSIREQKWWEMEGRYKKK